MDHKAMERKLRDIYESSDPQKLAEGMNEMAAQDFVQEWPQSGERIRGLENVTALNEQYEQATGTSPKMTVRRIVPPGDAWIVEATIDYGDGVPVSAVTILETNAKGELVHETDYFASPFEAPEWRRKFVEQMEPAGAR